MYLYINIIICFCGQTFPILLQVYVYYTYILNLLKMYSSYNNKKKNLFLGN